MPNFVVTYDLPHRHQVAVGVTAENAEAASAAAEAAFDAGTIWDNTPEMPLLMDLYEEDETGGDVLTFEAVETTEPYEVDSSVAYLHQDRKAVAVCEEIARFAEQARLCRESVDADALADLLRKATEVVRLPESTA